MSMRRMAALAGGATLLALGAAVAQVPQYGPNITLDQARKAYAGADAEARKNSWPVAIAIVDTSGNLVYFARHDNTQYASMDVAIDKAVSAAIYRRTTKVVQDLVAAGGVGLRLLNLRGMSAVEGGIPIHIDGKIVGAIGVSGVTADQDGVIARAGIDGMK